VANLESVHAAQLFGGPVRDLWIPRGHIIPLSSNYITLNKTFLLKSQSFHNSHPKKVILSEERAISDTIKVYLVEYVIVRWALLSERVASSWNLNSERTEHKTRKVKKESIKTKKTDQKQVNMSRAIKMA